jgi:hypothetical protein
MIIAINGKINSGKDTVASIIQYLTWNPNNNTTHMDLNLWLKNVPSELKAVNSGWYNKKFADKLKDIVCILLGCTREELEDREFKEKELGEEWAIPLSEEFTDIKDYEGLYQISNYGNVKSLSRTIDNGKYIRTSVDIISSTQYNNGGYKIISLWKGGKKQTFTIHKLVADAFLTNGIKTDGVINHIDNNKDNNRIDNLEIVSQLYNSNCHKTTNGVRRNISGNYTARITINKSRITLGTYNTEEEAISARNKKLQDIDTFIPIRYIPKIYTPRLLMQLIGTECFRNKIHYNTWINALFSEYVIPMSWDRSDIKKEYSDWIITDMRFPNELKAVKDKDGISIMVHRDLYKGNAHIAPIPHESETALDNSIFDYVIDNNGTIEELIEKVKEILIKEQII